MTDFEKYIADKIARLESLITEKSNRLDFPAWLSVKQCGQYLGLSESTVRKMISAGQIPFRRLPTAEGGSIKFNKRQVDLWLLSGSVKPTARQREGVKCFITGG